MHLEGELFLSTFGESSLFRLVGVDIFAVSRAAMFKSENSLKDNALRLRRREHKSVMHRDGEVTFAKELRSSSSYFQMRNLGTLVTSVTVTAINI